MNKFLGLFESEFKFDVSFCSGVCFVQSCYSTEIAVVASS